MQSNFLGILVHGENDTSVSTFSRKARNLGFLVSVVRKFHLMINSNQSDPTDHQTHRERDAPLSCDGSSSSSNTSNSCSSAVDTWTTPTTASTSTPTSATSTTAEAASWRSPTSARETPSSTAAATRSRLKDYDQFSQWYTARLLHLITLDVYGSINPVSIC